MTNEKVNSQILDSVLSVNEIVLGSSAAGAMATMYTNLAHSAGMASQNAVANQQHLNILATATIAAGTNTVLGSTQISAMEQLTPTQKLDYLKKLMSLAEQKPAAPAETLPAATPATAPDPTPAAANTAPNADDSSTSDTSKTTGDGDADAS